MRPLVASAKALAAAGLLLGPATAIAQDEPADLAQAQQLIAHGPHTLTGRPAATRYSLPQTDAKGKKVKPKSKTERVYSKNEIVYLIPMTDKIASVMARGGNFAVLRANLFVEGGAALKYNARTFTREDGTFRLRGLKPGRYLLMTEVPYLAGVTTKRDTGKVRTETTTQGYPVFQGGAQIGFVPTWSNTVVSPIYRYDKSVEELRNYILEVVEVRGDAPVTNLGEIE